MRNTFLLLRFGVFLLESIKYEIFDTNGYIGASVYAFFSKVLTSNLYQTIAILHCFVTMMVLELLLFLMPFNPFGKLLIALCYFIRISTTYRGSVLNGLVLPSLPY